MQYTDEQFMRALNRKKEDAFKIFFQNYYASLVIYAMRYVRQEIAEDIVQDLAASLWEKDTRFDTIASFHAFIYVFIRNRSLNFLKHQKAELNYIRAVEREDEQEEAMVFQIMEEEIYRMFFNVVDHLPNRCKLIFKLHLAGKKEQEIATLLHISVATVKSQKQKAFLRLKERLHPLLLLLLSL